MRISLPVVATLLLPGLAAAEPGSNFDPRADVSAFEAPAAPRAVVVSPKGAARRVVLDVHPPSGEETDSTRCVTLVARFLGIGQDRPAKIRGAGGCTAMVEYERYESGLSDQMDRRIHFDATDGSGTGQGHPFGFLGDLEELASQSVVTCEASGDVLSVEYDWSEKVGWGKSYRIKARVERAGGALAAMSLSKKENRVFGGGSESRAECRAAR